MIVLRTPKGWTGPKVVDGKQVEGTLALASGAAGATATNRSTCRMLEQWLQQLPAGGAVRRRRARCMPEIAALPRGHRRMGANPHANGGLLLRDLRCRISATTRSTVREPGATDAEDDARARAISADVMRLNAGPAKLPHLRAGRDSFEPSRRASSK